VATEVFKNAKIRVKPAATADNVKATLALVESGEVDAGVVYVTDVKAAGSKVHSVVIPDNLNASTEYPIATLTKSTNPTLAKAWVDYVLSPDGTKVLQAAGFTAP
jgi:molybdate transport system substrate-binding protein